MSISTIVHIRPDLTNCKCPEEQISSVILLKSVFPSNISQKAVIAHEQCQGGTDGEFINTLLSTVEVQGIATQGMIPKRLFILIGVREILYSKHARHDSKSIHILQTPLSVN